MITILKQTPITFKGCDALEVLVLNDELKHSEICSKCVYRQFDPDPDLCCSCVDLHGCTYNFQSYFVIIE